MIAVILSIKSIWKRIKLSTVKCIAKFYYMLMLLFDMSFDARRKCSNKIMLDHMCLYSQIEFCINLNGIFCHTHHIALILFLQTTTFFHTCSYILLMLFLTLHRMSKMRVICFWTHSHQVFGSKTLKNYQTVGIKSIDFGGYYTTHIKGTLFMFFTALY